MKYAILFLATVFTFSAGARAASVLSDSDVTKIKQKYEDLVRSEYQAVLSSNLELLKKVQEFVKAPSAETQEAAKTAWKKARLAYSPTEPFRYYGGPIDDTEKGVEALMNSWPIDENYIDYVKDNPKSGFVTDTKVLPEISKKALADLNAKGGERNVSTGYHAVEFLLWGQDFSTTGPGERPFSDYLPTDEAHKRRGQVIIALCELLVDNSQYLVDSWQPGSAFIKKFEALPSAEFMRQVLVGMTSLSADEMAGERLTVALEKNDPEHEQDCFSDYSVEDLKANEQGITDIYTKTGLKEMFEKKDKATAKKLLGEMKGVQKSFGQIKVPLDSLILDPKAKGRKDIRDAITHLQKQAQAIGQVAKNWSIELNVQSE